MKKEKANNLFDFATSELSQDAFICWCLNWFNDENPVLKEMSTKLINSLLEKNIEIESVDIEKQYSRKYVKDGVEKPIKIDILLIVNKTIGVIIEDKTNTEIHDEQIQNYKEGILELLKQNGSLDNKYNLDPNQIKTVFWKTGFYNDYDKVIEADKKICGRDVVVFLEPYVEQSEILKEYYLFLKERIRRLEEQESFMLQIDEKGWYISNYTKSQYSMMRSIFPDERWKRKKNKRAELFQVYHGTSYGRPWTEMVIYYGKYPDTKEYEIFWRIDTDSKGPYMSLRLYEKNDITDDHKGKYKKLKGKLEKLVTKRGISWDTVNPGNREGNHESDMLHFQLKNVLQNWDTYGKEFTGIIRSITDEFLEWIDSNA